MDDSSNTLSLHKCRILSCDKTFQPRGRRLYCSPECSRKAMFAQLATLSAKRKAEAEEIRKQELVCKVCKKKFKLESPQAPLTRSFYCGSTCKVGGLRRSVEAQRLRRLRKREAQQAEEKKDE